MRLEGALGAGVRHVDGDDTRLTVEDVDLHLPDGRPLVTHVNLSLLRGDSVLLGGASGSGKSTLFRAIAGIWPFGRGEIRASPRARVLFLPQRPYLPIGTLRSVVSYPMPAAGAADATLREALEAGASRRRPRPSAAPSPPPPPPPPPQHPPTPFPRPLRTTPHT